MSEYWIKDDGDVVFCDGDSGQDVPNHAAVVVHHCCQLIIDELENHDDAWAYALRGSFERFLVDDVVDCVALRSELNDLVDEWVDAKFITVKEAEHFYDAMIKRYGVDPVTLSAACGQHSDPRVLGTTKFDWIRVIENNFDCWSLSRSTCSRMFEFALEHEDVDEWNVEVANDGLFVHCVPPHDLDDPCAIRKLARVNTV